MRRFIAIVASAAVASVATYWQLSRPAEGLGPRIAPPPFAADAVVAYYHGGIVGPFNLRTIMDNEPEMYGVPTPGLRVKTPSPTPTWWPTYGTPGPTEEEPPCEMPVGEPAGMGFANEEVPVAQCKALDWDNVYPLHYAIQISVLDEYDWPGSTIGQCLVYGSADCLRQACLNAITRIKPELQAFHASLLRDVNVDARVDLVYCIPNRVTPGAWDTLVPLLPRPIESFQIWRNYGNSGAFNGLCATDVGRRYNGIFFDMVWQPPWQSGAFLGAPHIYTQAQEWVHTNLLTTHSQCYPKAGEPYMGGERITQCHENACSAPVTVCPTSSDVGYMDYCQAQCNYPTTGNGHNLRSGRKRDRDGDGLLDPDPMACIMRYNLLNARALGCESEPPVGALDYLQALQTDTDGDEYPDAVSALPGWGDNCTTKPNNSQSDHDFDGVGDPCDACAVGPGDGGGWWLMLPALVLLWRRVRESGANRSISLVAPIRPKRLGWSES